MNAMIFRPLAWALFLLFPLLAYSQTDQISNWSATKGEMAETESFEMGDGNTATGSAVVIEGIEFDVTYAFGEDEVLNEKIYTSAFQDDAARDAAYEALTAHFQSQYGDPVEKDHWVHTDAIVRIEKAPAKLNLYLENPESPEDRIARKKRELEEYKNNLMEEIGASEHPLRLKECAVSGESNKSVQVFFDYYGPKTVKFMWFTVEPYSDSGTKLKCNSAGHSAYTFEIMGPFRKSKVTNDVSWDGVWSNANIDCAKLTKLKVEYTDGSTYTYVREIDAISWPFFENNCQ